MAQVWQIVNYFYLLNQIISCDFFQAEHVYNDDIGMDAISDDRGEIPPSINMDEKES